MGFKALDVDDFYDEEVDVDDGEFYEEHELVIPDVTWKQRVYVLWLTLLELQSTIEKHNRATIGAVIDQRLREASLAGHRYRKIEAYQRVRECGAMVRNILRRRPDEEG